MEARAGGVLAETEPQMGLYCQGEPRGRSVGQRGLLVQTKTEREKRGYGKHLPWTQPQTGQVPSDRRRHCFRPEKLEDNTRIPQRSEDPFSQNSTRSQRRHSPPHPPRWNLDLQSKRGKQNPRHFLDSCIRSKLQIGPKKLIIFHVNHQATHEECQRCLKI